jgi:hypothetical protein
MFKFCHIANMYRMASAAQSQDGYLESLPRAVLFHLLCSDDLLDSNTKNTVNLNVRLFTLIEIIWESPTLLCC